MPRRPWLLVPCLALVVAATSAEAQPIPAATPEGIMCASTYVAVGRVLDAAIAGPDDLVDLEVKIIEVIGARKTIPSYSVGRSLASGDVVPLRLPLFATLVVSALSRHERPMLAEGRVREIFVGKAFIFAVAMMDNHVRSLSTFPANVWPLSERAWAIDTMSRELDGNCPRPR